MLTFDETTHTYHWNGAKVPGVTSILREWIQITVGVAGSRFHVNRYSGLTIPSEVMEEASAKGKDLHRGCQLILQEGLDWEALPSEYLAPLQQFEKWQEEFRPEVLFTEVPVFHPKYQYAGTVDIIAVIDGILHIIDIKTGASSSVGPQTAAYEKAWLAQEKYLRRSKRAALWLPKDGSPYKFQPLSNVGDFDFFKVCLYQRQFLKGK